MAYVVITRALDGTTAYAAALAPFGLPCVAMPVTKTEAIDSGLDRVLRERRYQAIAVASARAARALADAWAQPARADGRISVATWYETAFGNSPDPVSPDLDQRGRVVLPRVWAVGAATARVLEDAGIPSIVEPSVTDGRSLAQAIVEELADGERSLPLQGVRILVPRAADGRTELLEALVDAGATSDAVSVYRTVFADANDPAVAAGLDALMSGEAAICAVLAPSQVAALDAMLAVRTLDTLFAAIGETTAQALREAGAKRVAVATEPTPEGIAKAVRSVYPPNP